MGELTDILIRIMGIVDRVRNMEQISTLGKIAMAVILAFGLLNCIFGYRLLRFWMMLGGFFVGTMLGLFGAHTMGVTDKMIYLGAMLGVGILLAVIAFFIYKAGIFLVGAGIGWVMSIYILHPTTSAVFFACILIGIALGSLGVKYSREVLVVATSLIGGLMAGTAMAHLGSLPEIPYGIGMSAGFALIGILIQFAINKPERGDYDDYGEYEEYEEYEDESPVKDKRYRRDQAEETDDRLARFENFNYEDFLEDDMEIETPPRRRR